MGIAAVSSSTIVAPVVSRLGSAPELAETARPEPAQGQGLVRTSAATISPLDVFMASGRFPFPMAAPYVPGGEGCGVVVESMRLAPGTRVRFQPPFPPMQGALGPLCAVQEEDLIPVPDGAADDIVACLGYTCWPGWFALTYHAQLREGEAVLVLGATGPVGQCTVQLARQLRAGRIVGAGRDVAALERLRALGADAVVRISDQSPEELAQQYMEAAGGPVNVIVDGLWGMPALAAIGAAGFGARFVNLGESAAPAVEVAASQLRFKGITLRTHGNPLIPAAQRAEAFGRLVELVQAGRLHVEREVHPVERFADAWALAAGGARRRIVVSFE
jgi:NADPH:quinone reductase-like Zn-dependent oxidoreductase